MKRLCASFFYTKSYLKLSQLAKQPQPILRTSMHKTQCDFTLMDNSSSSVDSLVIVNNELNDEWVKKGLNCCSHVILADGGANIFYNSAFRNSKKVRYIVGDFDSLDTGVGNFYEDRGVKLQKVWNQDTNDFQKAVKKSIISGWNKIFCFGAFGGRMDHTLGTMHLSTKLCHQYPQLEIVLFGQTNLMYFLKPHIHYTIRISDSMEKEGCGLVSFGRAESVMTKGFRWNLGPGLLHESLEWGSFISTSNKVEGDTVQIQSSDPLFFVSQLK